MRSVSDDDVRKSLLTERLKVLRQLGHLVKLHITHSRKLSSHTMPYHILDLKRQNRLKVGTDKPKLKVKM